jgi:hypothetical protein
VLIAALTTGFVERVEQNPSLSQSVKDQVNQVSQAGIPVVPVEDVEQAARNAGATEAEATALGDHYGDAQLQALKRSIGAVGIFALLAFWFTRRLPSRTLADVGRSSEPATVASPP